MMMMLLGTWLPLHYGKIDALWFTSVKGHYVTIRHLGEQVGLAALAQQAHVLTLLVLRLGGGLVLVLRGGGLEHVTL